MSELLPPNSSNNSLGGRSKIEDYGLADVVWQRRIIGETHSSIAEACNTLLQQRNDGRTYSQITVLNVSEYCRRIRKDLEEYKGDILQKRLNEAVDVVKAIHQGVRRIELMLDVIGPDAKKAKDFAEVIDKLHKMLELLASVQGKLQPAITVQVYNQSIEAIVQVVVQDEFLPNEDKRRIVKQIAAKVLPVGESS